MSARPRHARVEDVTELAMSLPHVTCEHGPRGNPVYRVGGKSFVFFRNPRPDAVDPVTGERYPDVIMFWVPSESDKQALIQDEASPFFTTPHFDGHPSVLLRASRIGELSRQELAEVVQDAWLSQASWNWWRREGVGGTIPVRFPSESDPGDAGWHIESSYQVDGESRVSVGTRNRGLLALFLFTDVSAVDAPTRLRPGSHLDVPPILAPAGPNGRGWLEAAQETARASAHRPTALATGRAGDVFLCHPFLVHAASWPHRGRRPRMIAQPGVALHTEYSLDPVPGVPPPPVEQAILAGLAASRQAGA